jgi:hypothetical protein
MRPPTPGGFRQGDRRLGRQALADAALGNDPPAGGGEVVSVDTKLVGNAGTRSRPIARMAPEGYGVGVFDRAHRLIVHVIDRLLDHRAPKRPFSVSASRAVVGAQRDHAPRLTAYDIVINFCVHPRAGMVQVHVPMASSYL